MAENFYLDNPDLRFRVERADLGSVGGHQGAGIFLCRLPPQCAPRFRRRPGRLAPRAGDTRRHLRERHLPPRGGGGRGGRELRERPRHLRQGDSGRHRGIPQVRDTRLYASLGVRRTQPPGDRLSGNDRNGVQGRRRAHDHLRPSGDRVHDQRIRRRGYQGARAAALRQGRSVRRDGPDRARCRLRPGLRPMPGDSRRGHGRGGG